MDGEAVRPGRPGRGYWFEELAVGQVFDSPGRTITETDVVNFAGLSGDYTPVHTDAEYARRMPFRRRIAHGMLVQSIATGLGTRTGVLEGTIAAISGVTIDWKAPVFPGDTIRLRLEVAELGASPAKRTGRVVYRAHVLNQRDQVVSEGTWSAIMLRAPRAAARPIETVAGEVQP
ncbi:MAG: MaoC/PaaZ C-terminal domain-containing protein [Planctomycetota bacterium]